MSKDDGHGPSLRGTHSRVTRNEILKGLGAGVTLGKAARIMRSADEVRAHVKSHHAKHAQRWVDARLNDKLANTGSALAGPRPMLSLPGADPLLKLTNDARREVAGKLSARLERVSRAEKSMIGGAPTRESRRPSWGLGLG